MRRVIVAVLIAVMAAVTGCAASSTVPPGPVGVSPPPSTVGNSSPAPAPSSSAAPAPPPSATGSSGTLRVLVEPAAGIEPIYTLITGARSSVDLTMYELRDATAEDDLAADAKRGVDVRVILDQNLEQSRNTAAYDFLSAHDVHVSWGPAGTTYHQKTLTVDNATSVIMTLNMVTGDYPGTRDFAITDTRPADVHAIIATFNADCAHTSITPPDGADLVWSPTNSQSSILAVINGAKRTLSVENEEMDDPAITAALAAAERRGVDVKVVMTANPEWDEAFAELESAGVHVRLYADSDNVLYIHAKAIVADAGRPDQQAFAGSENFSPASLYYNRELGIATTSSAVVSDINTAIASDYAGAAPQSPAATSRPAPAKTPGAWCTATASVYNAHDDENNVYVRSNQPYQSATASTGGYSHSYETSGSGDALIYLNGPPPGAQITVTVDGATCTTSD
jgi:cardiolipin synthase